MGPEIAYGVPRDYAPLFVGYRGRFTPLADRVLFSICVGVYQPSWLRLRDLIAAAS